MSAIKFGIVGAGWRCEFYLRIARALPEQFEVTGVVVRSDEKRLAFEKAWGVTAFATLDDMLAKTAPGFVPPRTSPGSTSGIAWACSTSPTTSTSVGFATSEC